MAEKKKKMQLLLLLHTRKPNNMIIPNDVIIEILSRIPAKSLLRLRWTCKYLFDLITNTDRDVHDYFIKIHLHRSATTISPPPPVLSFYFMNSASPDRLKLYQGYYLNYNDTNHHHHGGDVPRSSEVNRIDHPSAYPFVQEYIHAILGSSNGLILLRLSHHYKWHKLNLCILNPCTKEYKILPHPLLTLASDTYGFGYDETMDDDYKVIRILHSEVEVYTLGRDSWRRIGPCPYELSSSAGVFMNGVLYWMDFMHENIISFDIGMEKFQLVAKTPPNLNGNDDELHKLQVFEGSLCLVLKTTHRRNSLVEIWVMKKDYTVNNNNNNESLLWTKLLTIPDIRHFPIKPVRYTRNGKILVLNNHKDLVLYDPKNTSDPKTLRRMSKNRCRFLVLEVYTESLVSLNSGTYTSQDRIKEDIVQKLMQVKIE